MAVIDNQPFKKTTNRTALQQSQSGGGYYQVKRNDRSITDVANKNGVSPEELVRINKTKTLPPVGSYMQLQDQRGPLVDPLAFQGGLANPAPRTPTSQQKTGLAGQGGLADPARGNAQLSAQAYQIRAQLANGQLPSSIPSSALSYLKDNKGQPVTIQDLIAEGYTMNNQGVLVRGAAATGQVQTAIGTGSSDFMNTGFMRNNIEKNVDFMNQLRWDPKKKKYVKIGTLIRQGRLDIKTGKMYDTGKKRNKKGKLVNKNKSGGSTQTTAPVGQPTTEGPQTVLDIHLGSG